MSASASAMTSATTVKFPGAFWERLWRMNGINFVLFAAIAYLIYGWQPSIGASADALTAFYVGDRVRIFIAAIVAGQAVLALMWFAAALRTALADLGQDGWGAAATAASAALGGMFLLLVGVSAALAYSIAGAGNAPITSALNDVLWASVVLTSLPRAMLIMAPTFGFWRAGVISNRLFAVGVAAVVLGVLGSTTWASDGFWAPDGLYSRYIWPLIGLAWVVVLSRVLAARPPGGRGW